MKRVINILIVSNGLFALPSKEEGGGVEAHIYLLVNELAKLNLKVHLVSRISDKKDFDKNIVFHEPRTAFLRPSHKDTLPRWIFCLIIAPIITSFTALKAIIKYHPEIIHSHDAIITIIVKIFLKIINKKIPVILTIHSPSVFYKYYNNWLVEFIRKVSYKCIIAYAWRIADHLIALNNYMKKELVLSWRINKNKVTVIPHIIDTNFFVSEKNLQTMNDILLKYNIKEPYCIFVGQLSKRKGIDLLLYALAKTQDIRCVIVGDGPLRDFCKTLSIQFNISSRVIFTGNVKYNELRALYTKAKFLVFPSFSEAFAIVPLEALSCGIPVIMFKVPGADELESSNSVVIVKDKSADTLAKSIQELWNNNNFYENLKRNTRKYIIRNYSAKVITKKILEVYLRLVKY